jgi:hypothetical protein
MQLIAKRHILAVEAASNTVLILAAKTCTVHCSAALMLSLVTMVGEL